MVDSVAGLDERRVYNAGINAKLRQAILDVLDVFAPERHEADYLRRRTVSRILITFTGVLVIVIACQAFENWQMGRLLQTERTVAIVLTHSTSRQPLLPPVTDTVIKKLKAADMRYGPRDAVVSSDCYAMKWAEIGACQLVTRRRNLAYQESLLVSLRFPPRVVNFKVDALEPERSTPANVGPTKIGGT